MSGLMSAPPRPIVTPCIKVCVVDGESGLCMGCYRQLSEVAGWAALSEPTPQAAVAISEPAVSPASISKAADGHYWAEADVDGHAIHFLVDTGASAVALTTEDAQRLGIDTTTLDYKYGVVTASGEAHAAQVKLASISVAGARVDNVEAFVLDRGLQTSLLGMTYLGRLSAFEATPQ